MYENTSSKGSNSSVIVSRFLRILVTYGQVYIQEQPTNLITLFEKENFSQGEDPVTILHQSPDMIVIKESATNPQGFFWKSLEILIKNGFEIASITSVPTELNLENGSINTDHVAVSNWVGKKE